ncbi:nucleotidyltransferase domain-containing protein [Sphaerochaeta globosa]|uniref:DNA polymerase beta domain protein region n=1 Tax=Sphaerochaeta globosa (strain ATCC BAA-1886 / DSM 22777 / Buddy) TaxID=158189 RepID=F0RY07_SPHGB|nr:nucleotidyltransferase domain-containing protein [Sphaerochaeta globosa]ADY12431.1 DNA polymerase beta domain protein region [Sphaerochaeta globosa str. Buddy]
MKSKPDAKELGLRPEILDQLDILFKSYKEIDAVILYGSRAKGTYRPGSDIDITIKGEHFEDSLVGKLAEEIDDLLLPYSFDISSWSQIDNPDLLAHIERVGIIIYQKPKPAIEAR